MNEKKIARNALPWSSRPTFGPTASVRTIVKAVGAGPRLCVRAESTAAAVASVVPSAVVPAVPIRARITYSFGPPNCWISASRIPAASRAPRIRSAPTDCAVCTWISVPPVNSIE